MKRVLRVSVILFVLSVLVIGAWVTYISATWRKDYSDTEKPALAHSTDPEVIKRGEYMVHAVAHCSICHVPRQVTEKRQVGERPTMVGGYEWKMGPLGTLYSPNITADSETGIGAWTDAELARAIRWGVGRDGKQLTFMTLSVPSMADEDLVAVISYLRAAPAVKQEDKESEPGFLLKWLATKVSPEFRRPFLEGLTYAAPAEEPSVERGAYLARGPGWCVSCHTPFDLMEMKLAGAELSGNSDAEPDPEDDTKVYRAPNLTPDPKTGHITGWDEEAFVKRFRAGRILESSKMPWEAFREMTEVDLRSLYRYLRSVPPVQHYIGPPHRDAAEDPARDEAARL